MRTTFTNRDVPGMMSEMNDTFDMKVGEVINFPSIVAEWEKASIIRKYRVESIRLINDRQERNIFLAELKEKK
jgi:hypothetical protein